MTAYADKTNDAPSVSYPYFRSQVVKHDQKTLLKQIASQACKIPDFVNAKHYRFFFPWAMAAMARESLAYGGPHQSTPLAVDAISTLNYHYLGCDDIIPDDEFMFLNLAKFEYEQLMYQTPLHHDLARSFLLLERTTIKKSKTSCWTLFQTTTAHAIEATIVLYCMARASEGLVPSGDLDPIEWSSVGGVVPLRVIEKTRDRLTETPAQLRQRYLRTDRKFNVPARYAYNPLYAKPLVNIGGSDVVAPQPHLILNSMTPESLYHLGIEVSGSHFPSELGRRAEAYTGRLFRKKSGMKIHPEVRLNPRNQDLSIDWILVTKKSVVLIECKGAFMSLPGRAGDGREIINRTDKYIGGARGQINNTYAEMTTRKNPAFNHILPIKGRRKFYGLVVTGGDFYVANSEILTKHISTAPSIHTRVASLHEVEMLASLSAGELDSFLCYLETDPAASNMSIETALRKFNVGKQTYARQHRMITSTYKKVILPMLERNLRRFVATPPPINTCRMRGVDIFHSVLSNLIHEIPPNSFVFSVNEWKPGTNGNLIRIPHVAHSSSLQSSASSSPMIP